MKKCPTCQKTFDDNLRFCQTDGTPLVEDAPPPDPYATMVASKEEIMAGMPPINSSADSSPVSGDDDDLLDIPAEDERDSMKTMYVSDAERHEMLDDSASKPIPPPLFGESDLSSEPVSSSADTLLAQPEPPKFSEPDLNPPSFGNMSSSSDSSSTAPPGSPFGNEPPSFDKQPFPSSFDEPKQPADNPFNTPIPSPFGEQMPPSYNAPSSSPFEPPAFKVEEAKAEALNTPFADEVSQGNQAVAESSWTPPAAPEQSWGNQEIGQNTPFQPPPVGTGGQNQTLPIISLVLGILSLCCYVSPITGIAAIVTGFLGMKNAKNDPANYGGKTLAIVGMILGGLFFLVGVAYYILWLVIGVASFVPQ